MSSGHHYTFIYLYFHIKHKCKQSSNAKLIKFLVSIFMLGREFDSLCNMTLKAILRMLITVHMLWVNDYLDSSLW